jgi:hypothetical protein
VALAMGSAFATYLCCELLVSRLLLDRVPLDHQAYLAPAMRALAQNSKAGIVPRPGYILLEGDSYAMGAGDWLKGASPFSSPRYHSAHLLRERTGRDVMSFGRSGLGSLGGFVGEPRRLRVCLNRLPLFSVPEPGLVILYFYEGNDLDDTLAELERWGRDPADRFAFLATLGAAPGCSFFDDFVLATALRRRVGALFHGPAAGDDVEWPVPNVDRGDATANVVRIAGVRKVLPLRLQGPSLGLSSAEVELALAAVEHALSENGTLHPDVPRLLVYLPSPLGSYPLLSRAVDVQVYRKGDPRRFPSAAVSARSDLMATRLRAACARAGVAFLDTRPALRAVAAQRLIHGPRDFKHYNESGYAALADAVAAVLPP